MSISSDLAKIDHLIQQKEGEIEQLKRLREEMTAVTTKFQELFGDERGAEKPEQRSHSHISASTGRIGNKRAMILQALEAPRALWQDATRIANAVTHATGTPVRTSLISPSLTELKNSGLIQRNGLEVALTERLRTEDPEFFKEKDSQSMFSGSESPSGGNAP